MDSQPTQEPQSLVIGMKIIGVLVTLLSFRWLVKIFGGKDGLNEYELKKLVAFLFFISLASWMTYKEGERLDLSHEVYGTAWLAIVFGALLTVLHLDTALDKIARIVEALAKLRTGTTAAKTETTHQTQITPQT